MVGQIPLFNTIMTVFVRSNNAKFGQNTQLPKKNILHAPKNYNDKKMRNENIMV